MHPEKQCIMHPEKQCVMHPEKPSIQKPAKLVINICVLTNGVKTTALKNPSVCQKQTFLSCIIPSQMLNLADKYFLWQK